MSTYIISDIHGSKGLEDLINKINPSLNDIIYSVGDLFDRGIYGYRVYNLIKEYNIKCCLGNHEAKMEKWLSGKRSWVPPHYKWCVENMCYPGDNAVCSREELLKFIQSLPLLYNLGDCIITHGFIDIENPTKENVSCNVYGNLSDKRRVFKRQQIITEEEPLEHCPENEPWKHWKKDSPIIIYGHVCHKDNKPLFWKNENGIVNSIGIDTAGVHGYSLTALKLETKEIIQVGCEDEYSKLKELMKNDN